MTAIKKPITEIDYMKIVKTRNGWLLAPSRGECDYHMACDQWCFESIDAMLKFMRKELKEPQ